MSAAILAGAGFLVPFMFVYGPALLLDGSPGEILLALVTGVAGVTALAASGMGYARRVLAPWERVMLGVAAVALVFPGVWTDLVGLMGMVVGFRGMAEGPE